MIDLHRRRLVTAAGAAGAVAALSACGGGGSDTPAAAAPPPSAGPRSCGSPNISSNHGHELVIPVGDTTSANSLSYSIRGTSAHDHLITLSPAQLAQIRGGTTIFVTSTTSEGHTHTVTVNCALT